MVGFFPQEIVSVTPQVHASRLLLNLPLGLFNVVFPSLSILKGRDKVRCCDTLAFVQSCLTLIGQIFLAHEAWTKCKITRSGK